jgi:hypothetical protein
MTQLQSALILAGVGVVVLVYLYNWWQHVRRRREIERAVAAHRGRERNDGGDPLDPLDPGALSRDAFGAMPSRSLATRPTRQPSSRVEPVVADESDDAATPLPPTRVVPVSTADSGAHIGAEPPTRRVATVRAPLVDEPESEVRTRDVSEEPAVVAGSRDAELVASYARQRGPAPRVGGLPLRPDPLGIDFRVDFLARMLPLEPVSAESLADILANAPDVGRQMTVLGCPVGGQDWQPVLRQSLRYEEVAVALQQVDRSGLIAPAALERFARWVDDVAERITATCIPPDLEASHAVAAELDAFCAEADVLIGINVVAPDVPVPATKVRALAEAAGFRLQPLGHFALENDDGLVLLTLSDIEGRPFISDQIRTAASSGVTLLLDIPRTPQPARVYNQMMQIARQMAQGIGGRIVDDKRQGLSDAGVRIIGERIAALESRLAAQRMAAGSALARRVFS